MKNKLEDTRIEPKELDLGERKVSKMNFSHIVTLPKKFIRNSPYGKITRVSMTLLKDGSLKLTPARQKNEPDEFSIM
ncbi:MAG: hypothetical protein KGI28_03815 [Thaumarchaeota archaeon]|nr:hypothetical protein [Nitrososphaerota archaeon]